MPLDHKTNTAIKILANLPRDSSREQHWYDYKVDLWWVNITESNSESVVESVIVNIAKLLTAKYEQETAVNNLPPGKDVMAVYPTGFGKSLSFKIVFHCLLSPDKNCRPREPVSLLFRCYWASSRTKFQKYYRWTLQQWIYSNFLLYSNFLFEDFDRGLLHFLQAWVDEIMKFWNAFVILRAQTWHTRSDYVWSEAYHLIFLFLDKFQISDKVLYA